MKHTTSGRIGYWETMVGPEKYGLWGAESVTVLGRTFPVSDPWKSTASERPSNAKESLGGRARVQIAATLICGNVWSHPADFRLPIDTHGTYINHSRRAATRLPRGRER